MSPEEPVEDVSLPADSRAEMSSAAHDKREMDAQALKNRFEQGDRLTMNEKTELASWAQGHMAEGEERESFIKRIYGVK